MGHCAGRQDEARSGAPYGWTLGPNFSFDHQAVRTAAWAIDHQISKSARTTWLAQGASAELKTETPQWANWSHHLALAAYSNLPGRAAARNRTPKRIPKNVVEAAGIEPASVDPLQSGLHA